MLSLILKVSLSFKEKSNMNPMQTFNEIYFEENKLQYAVDYQLFGMQVDLFVMAYIYKYSYESKSVRFLCHRGLRYSHY